MTRERWGTFSVKDHLNTAALAREILLYDRLVIPIPSDDGERDRWAREGWAPELLDKRLETLGKDLVEPVPWDSELRKKYDQIRQDYASLKTTINDDFIYKFQELRQSGEINFGMTRRALIEYRPKTLPKGVTHVVSVAAYQSEADFRSDFILSNISNVKNTDQNFESTSSELGLLLRQKIVVPNWETPAESLKKAIDLAREREFKEHRRKSYDWQEDVAEKITKGKMTFEKALEEIDQLADKYNQTVKSKAKDFRTKFLFTVAPIALPLTQSLQTGHFDPIMTPMFTALGAAISIGGFMYSNRSSVHTAGEGDPAAMFHDIKDDLGWSWTRSTGSLIQK